MKSHLEHEIQARGQMGNLAEVRALSMAVLPVAIRQSLHDAMLLQVSLAFDGCG